MNTSPPRFRANYRNTTHRWLAALLCCSAIAIIHSRVQAQYTNDFEGPLYFSGPLQGQDMWDVQRTNEVVLTASELATNLQAAGLTPGITVHSGDQAVLFSHPTNSGSSVRYLDGFSSAQKVMVDVWARPLTPRTDGAVNLGNIFMTVEGPGGVRAAAFRFGFDAATTNPHIDYATAIGSIWQSTGVPWTSNTWYQITMTLDFAEKTYDFAINGTRINTSPLAFYTGNTPPYLSQIRVFRGTSQAGMILDDLSVTDLTPTNPWVGTVASTPFGWSFNIHDAGTATPDTATITVSVDGVPVTPLQIAQSGSIGGGDGTGVTTVSYKSATPLFVSGSSHTMVVHFAGAGFSPVNTTNTFTVSPVLGSLDRVHRYLGKFQGKAGYSADKAGRSGNTGDYAVDIGTPARTNYNVLVTDADLLSALNAAAQNDVLTFSLWVKHRTTSSSSIFWAFSPSAPDSRGLQMHSPYYSGADARVFFDTGGTAEPGNRLYGWMTNYPSYSGSDTWWNAWHHVVAVKNSGTKRIWIDGRLLVEQTDSAAWLYYDISKLYLGCGVSGGNPSLSIDGWIDDFAAYSTALSGTDIASLHSGTAPDAISAKTSLLAWWDFNDVPAISLAKTGDKVVISFTEVLQAATNVSGPYVDLLDAKSPYTNDLTANPMRFFRTRK